MCSERIPSFASCHAYYIRRMELTSLTVPPIVSRHVTSRVSGCATIYPQRRKRAGSRLSYTERARPSYGKAQAVV